VVASFQHTFQKVLGLNIGAEEVLNDYGRPLTYSFGRYTQDKTVVDEMLRVYRHHNVDLHNQMTLPFPFVGEDLAQLHKLGYRMGLVTSKKRPTVLMGVRLFNMEDYFETLVCEEDTIEHKPQPEPLLEAMRRMQVLPNETLYIGDSPYDILCAHAAHVPSAAVLWSNFPPETWDEVQPTYRLQRLNQLLTLL
jgi:pyrophosphatase PpaX